MALFDVIEVRMDTNAVRVLDQGKTEANADAIVNMAVLRRGVAESFFATCPAGQYQDGDTYATEP